MEIFLITAVVGIIICLLGVSMMGGNINLLHSYHRHRVTEENRKPFGKIVGTGHFIIGIACILYGVFSLIFEKTQRPFINTAGLIIIIGGMIIGLCTAFYGMIKYNKGIF